MMPMRDCPECGVRLDMREQFYGTCNGWRDAKHCSNCHWEQPVGPVKPTAQAVRDARREWR
jgi:hypothetical protein